MRDSLRPWVCLWVRVWVRPWSVRGPFRVFFSNRGVNGVEILEKLKHGSLTANLARNQET